MNTQSPIYYPANKRGHANHGWLNAHHTFSFAGYYNPDRMGFGKIRVLNDDEIAPSTGFGEHPHDNMEIITIPLDGQLKHKDSTGEEGIITAGEVQIMSAGHGIRHSEFNASSTEAVKLFQIWIKTAEPNAEPRYGQKRFWQGEEHPKKVTLVSPKNDDSLTILQDATIEMLWLDEGDSYKLPKLEENRGVFAMLVEGQAKFKDIELNKRDALGFTQSEDTDLQFTKNSQLLVIHTPLN